MLNKEDIQKILNLSLDEGADFAELFFENTYSHTLKVIGKDVVSADTYNTFGVGIRLLKGFDEVYGYTNKTDYQNVLSLLLKLKKLFKEKQIKSLPCKPKNL